ncbi:MAG: acyl-CoA synthetase (AMP-forming)/AMP-acid ligase II [Gammaproteobacteria bacterium]|jgi:acyl-CoA synthetase (AMP-forming)/AMP-acid ligase II
MNDIFLLRLKDRGNLASQSIALSALGYRNLDYDSLARIIENIVEDLRNMGINKHDPIAFITDSDPATAILGLSLMSHAIAVPLNPDNKQNEIESLFSRIPIKLVIIPAGQSNSIKKMFEYLDIPIIEFNVNEWNIEFIPAQRPDHNVESDVYHQYSDDTALILQTSGSTAAPRIVPLSHRNLLAAADNVIRSLSLTEVDSCIHMLPMFHIGGFVDVLMAPLLSSGKVIFNQGFDSNRFFQVNRTFTPTWTQTVPAMLQELIDVAKQSTPDTRQSRLRFIRCVSSPLPERMYHSAGKLFSTSIVEIYGMTESAGVITSNPIQQEKQKVGSVGISAGPDLRIVSEDGVLLDPLQTGEVQIQGNSVMRGYLLDKSAEFNDPEFQDGWLKTGDLGYLDDEGYLFLTGRLKDIINRGGEKISPSEIDQIVLQHPMIIDAASFAVTHPVLGDDIALAIVAKPGNLSIEESTRAFLKDKLAYFKIPNQIIMVDEIPRENGKLKRHKLADQLLRKECDPGNKSSSTTSLVDSVSKELAEIWTFVLKTDQIGMDDDFFYMGGNSLLAIILVNELQERWGVSVIVSTIYDAPVLRDFEQQLKKEYPMLIDKIRENSNLE